MLYISKLNIEGKTACVSDTDDGTKTNISFSELEKVISVGVEVQGAYIDTNGLNIHKVLTPFEIARYLALYGKVWGDFVFADVGKSVIVSIPDSMTKIEVRPGGSILEYFVYRSNNVDYSKPFIFDNLILVGGNGLCTCKGMFWYMQHIKSVDLSNLNTSNVTSMAGMFASCSELRQVNLHGVNTKCVRSMCDVFHNCCNLTTLDLSSFYTRKVKDFSGMFGSCEKLRYLNFPGMTMRKDTSAVCVFSGCNHKDALMRSLPVSIQDKLKQCVN